jgi:hypothetical protein
MNVTKDKKTYLFNFFSLKLMLCSVGDIAQKWQGPNKNAA